MSGYGHSQGECDCNYRPSVWVLAFSAVLVAAVLSVTIAAILLDALG